MAAKRKRIRPFRILAVLMGAGTLAMLMRFPAKAVSLERQQEQLVAAAQAYHLRGGIAEQIQCPTLVCDAEKDLFFNGQAQQLYDHLTCRKTLMKFTDAEGAGAHCEVGASRLAFARMYDWLDETLSV